MNTSSETLAENIYQPFVMDAAETKGSRSGLEKILSAYDLLKTVYSLSTQKMGTDKELGIIRVILKGRNYNTKKVHHSYIDYVDLLPNYFEKPIDDQIDEYFNPIFVRIKQKEATRAIPEHIIPIEPTLEADETSTCTECKERYQEIMRSSIPISYAVFGTIVFTLMCVFATIFCIGQFTDSLIMNPKYSILSFLGCLVLFLTDLIACRSWRKLIDEEK